MKNYLLIITLLMSTASWAQQDPLFSYTLNSKMLINPAFTGSSHTLEGTALFRSQWQNIPGSPKSLAVMANTSLANNKMGVGLAITSDQLGTSNYTNINAFYSYRLELGLKSFLSFGLSAGMVQFKTDYSELLIRNAGDIFDVNETSSKFSFGAGLTWENSRALIAISAPRLIKVNQEIEGSELTELGRVYALVSSYNFDLTNKVTLRPSLLARLPDNGTLTYDLRTDIVISNKVSLGTYTRNFDYLGFTFGVLINPSIKFNYQYEIPIGDSPSQFTAHELSLSFRTKVLSKHLFNDWL